MIVVLGTPDAESADLYAETVMRGDPTWAGPLAGISLGLPVYHIIEPEIRDEIDSACYEEHLKLMEIALDVDKISKALTKWRNDG